MNPHRGLAWVLILFLAGEAKAADDLAPFVLPWDDGAPGPVSFIAKPRAAGADGFVIAGDDGHLHAGAGRVRFLGVNLAFGANFPSHEDAPKIAARMAKFGINAVRIHHADWQRYPGGLQNRNSKDSRHFDPEALDRFDFFVAQLKANGIYTDINLLVSRNFVPADGLDPAIAQVPWRDQALLGFFHRPLIDLQKEYARNLLTHVNPYTKLAYVDDPAISIVEINNENGLVVGRNALDVLPAPFSDQLRAQWNAWLKKKYATTAQLRDAWGVRSEPAGAEMLKNAEFALAAGQARNWVLEQHEGASATLTSLAQGRLRIDVTAAGKESWHVQFNQPGLALKKGAIYTVSFEAKSPNPLTIGVNVGMAHAPWQVVGLDARVKLTPERTPYHFAFIAAQDEPDARLCFSGLARAGASVELSAVSMRPGGAIGLEAAQTIEDGSIPTVKSSASVAPLADQRHDWIEFLWEAEHAYWLEMRDFLKKDLKVKCVVVGTSAPFSTASQMSAMDAIDSHAYWQHPHFPRKPWDPADWTVANQTMVNVPGGALVGLARARVEGKPHLVTEYQHPSPNTYSAEGPILLAAVASLQDWDGLFLFAYSHRANDWDARMIKSFFDLDQHPTKMANLRVAASIFLRGDVSPARGLTTVPLSKQVELDAWAAGVWSPDAAVAGLAADTMLTRRVAITQANLAPKVPPARPSAPAPQRYVSDTGQLTWDCSNPSSGLVTINAPRTRALVGYAGAQPVRLGDVTLTPAVTRQGSWCTAALTLTEGDSFSGPCRILAVATGEVQNTAMKWTSAKKESVGRDWGAAPSLVEVVNVTVDLPVAPQRVTAFALDELGRRAAPLTVEPSGTASRVRLGAPAATIWYEITIK